MTIHQLDSVPEDPFEQFSEWFALARTSSLHLPEAMALATASKAGRPSLRFVLLRGFDARGFCFYTNYNSRKSQELLENPWASLCFHWSTLERQVRVEGRVEKTSADESDTYWNSRAHDSRISALASNQSAPVKNYGELENRVRDLNQTYPNENVPRPNHWGGFRIVPDHIEFWQGQPHRLHERVVYTRVSDAWKISRLQP